MGPNTTVTNCGGLDVLFPAPINRYDLPLVQAILVQSIPVILVTLLWFLVEIEKPSFTIAFRYKSLIVGLLTSAVLGVVSWRILECLSCGGLVDDGWRVVASIMTPLTSASLFLVSKRYPRFSVLISSVFAAGSVFGSWATEGGGLVSGEVAKSIQSESPPFVTSQQLWSLLTVCLLSRLFSPTRISDVSFTPSTRRRQVPIVIDALSRKDDAMEERAQAPGWSWFF